MRDGRRRRAARAPVGEEFDTRKLPLASPQNIEVAGNHPNPKHAIPFEIEAESCSIQ
jgi:hypothetical protein